MKYSNDTPVPNRGSWSEQKEKLKKKFTVLTDGDLQFVVGKKDEMFDKIEDKIGKTKEELQKIIATL
jgi:uncharacterized protein YjbJ (UPF0337 family)